VKKISTFIAIGAAFISGTAYAAYPTAFVAACCALGVCCGMPCCG
jgi:hypothetical protein